MLTQPDPTSPRTTDRRALTMLGAAVALLAVLVAGRILWVRHAVVEDYAEVLERSMPRSVAAVDGWFARVQAEARVLATLASQESGLLEIGASAAEREAARTRFEAMLRATIDGQDGTRAAWLFDSTGRIVAGVAPDGDAAPSLDKAALGAPQGGRAAGIPGAVVDVRVPVRRPESMLASGVLALRVDAAPYLARELNPVSRENRTGRTSIVAREGEDVVVLASESNAPAEPLPRFPRRATPGYVLRALDGQTARGVAPADQSLFGREVAYAAAPLPSLDWAVVRQQDRAELLSLVRVPLMVEGTIWTLLGLLAIAAAAFWQRGRAARQDREAIRLRTDFVSGVSHELRTPLAQIRLFAQLLRAGTLRTKEEHERALRVIDQEARRLTFLVDNVLNFAKSEHGTARVQPVVTEVVGEIIEALEAFEPLAEERGVSLREDMQTGLYALVDPRALRQVLLNFLDNAVKYGPRGGTVTVGASQNVGMVRVWVDDDGPGVAPSERENIWRPFYRLQRAEQTETGGAGIGLAVVHELVLQHGGTVWVEAAPGGGARFVVEFPATNRTPTPVQSMLAAVRLPAAGAGASGR